MKRRMKLTKTEESRLQKLLNAQLDEKRQKLFDSFVARYISEDVYLGQIIPTFEGMIRSILAKHKIFEESVEDSGMSHEVATKGANLRSYADLAQEMRTVAWRAVLPHGPGNPKGYNPHHPRALSLSSWVQFLMEKVPGTYIREKYTRSQDAGYRAAFAVTDETREVGATSGRLIGPADATTVRSTSLFTNQVPEQFRQLWIRLGIMVDPCKGTVAGYIAEKYTAIYWQKYRSLPTEDRRMYDQVAADGWTIKAASEAQGLSVWKGRRRLMNIIVALREHLLAVAVEDTFAGNPLLTVEEADKVRASWPSLKYFRGDSCA